VDSSTIDNDNFKIDDTIIGREAFFTMLAVGDLVKARADRALVTDPLIWEQIELKD
jgi:hypothetical protein